MIDHYKIWNACKKMSMPFSDYLDTKVFSKRMAGLDKLSADVIRMEDQTERQEND